MRTNKKYSNVCGIAKCCVLLATLSVGCGNDYHEQVWSQRFDSLNESCGTDVAIDGAGDIVVVGTYKRSLNIGGDDLPTANGGALFLAKYNSDGVNVWSRQLTTEDGTPQMAVDDEGNIFVSVRFGPSVTLEGSTHTSTGTFDILLVKLSGSGDVLWSKSFGGSSSDFALELATVERDVVVAGFFREVSSFGGESLVSAGSSDGFVVRLDPEGEHVWSTSYGGSGSDRPRSLAVSVNGAVSVSGIFEGNIETAEFDGAHVVNTYSSDGALDNSWAIPGPARLVAWDSVGQDLFFAGEVEYPIALAAGRGELSGKFLSRIGADGDVIWQSKADDRDWRDIVVDDQDRVHLVSDTVIGSGDGRFVWLTSFDANGKKLGTSEVWDSLGGARVTAVAAGLDGRVVVTGCAYDDKVFGNDESFFLSALRTP